MQAAQSQRGVAMRPVDDTAHASDLVIERALPGARGRRDVGAEDPHADPGEPAEGPESVAVAQRKLDRGVPVDLNPEVGRPQTPGPGASGEDHRHSRDGVRAGLELRFRLTGRQPTHVDACDANPGRDAARGSREHQPEQHATRGRDGAEREHALHEQPP
jgi:hypothetical protein